VVEVAHAQSRSHAEDIDKMAKRTKVGVGCKCTACGNYLSRRRVTATKSPCPACGGSVVLVESKGKKRGDVDAPLFERIMRSIRHGDAPAHIAQLGPCWIWNRKMRRETPTIRDHHGELGVPRGMAVSRAMYLVAHGAGSIRDGQCVLHRCDNRLCVNPAHLFLGTQADNMKDMDAKGRRKVGNRWKFGPDEVRAIRARRAAGERGVDLAREFGVHENVICGMVNRRTHKNVD